MLLTKALSITELGSLLHLPVFDILELLLGIQAILMIPEDNRQPIKLVHTSLRDFLTTESRSLALYIDPPTHHLYIAADCLATIRQPPMEGICYSEDQKYASLNWCHHLCQGLVQGGGNHFIHLLPEISLMTCLLEFASSSVDFWVNTAIAANAMEDILKCLRFISLMFELLQTFPPNILPVLNKVIKHANWDWKGSNIIIHVKDTEAEYSIIYGRM